MRSIAMSVHVCMSVRSNNSKTCPNFNKYSVASYYVWPWLGPPGTTMQYVMYFRFCGMTVGYTRPAVCVTRPPCAAGRVCTENRAHGNRPCAWFTERLYTRPALCIASVFLGDRL